MRGTTRPLSLRRRLIADLMHASTDVPFVTLRRPLSIGPLLDARESVAGPPGFATIFAKAFSIAARDEPLLRTLALKWPWARLYELPKSIGLIAVAREEDGERFVVLQKVATCDALHLSATEEKIRHAKTAPVADIPVYSKLMRVTALPLPLRRLLWGVAMNSGRLRAQQAGTFGITSVSALGTGELHPLSPGPYLISYGRATAQRTMDVVIRWDHRVTDAALIAATLTRLETILNTDIAEELRELYPAHVSELRLARAQKLPNVDRRGLPA